MLTNRLLILKRTKYLIITLSTLFISQICYGEEMLRLSSSDQIYQAFGRQIIDDVSTVHHISVDVYPTYSRCALGRLVNGFSDIAAITHHIGYQMKAYGYVEIPFCRDPIAVIVNTETAVTSLTDKEFQGIFNRQITNWKEVGGADKDIILVIPGKNTEMYRNFYHTAMNRLPIQYDYIAYKSTNTIEAVKRFNGAISFIARGAVFNEPGVTILNINGMSPGEPAYPYYQTFSFVTKGQPEGAAERLINMAFSEKGKKMIQEKGMTPIDNANLLNSLQ